MKRFSNKSGFSLIELLVSMSIFTMVVVMTTGTLLVLIDANNKAQNMQIVMQNLTFALDSMTRDIRTSYNYYCSNSTSVPGISATQDCIGGGTLISIVESDNSLTESADSPRVTFRYVDNYYASGHGAILRRLGTTGDWLPLTSENVRISDMEFVVSGTTRGDNVQPMATIFIEGEAGDIVGLDTSFQLQTTITQRVIDI